mmetsp:Transcript_16451/g.45909  ORF Transcript_16451/g.45909 Transcript_16451/m.45909 type:complete len:248 (+) Transcript_16451:3045-3788(+)
MLLFLLDRQCVRCSISGMPLRPLVLLDPLDVQNRCLGRVRTMDETGRCVLRQQDQTRNGRRKEGTQGQGKADAKARNVRSGSPRPRKAGGCRQAETNEEVHVREVRHEDSCSQGGSLRGSSIGPIHGNPVQAQGHVVGRAGHAGGRIQPNASSGTKLGRSHDPRPRNGELHGSPSRKGDQETRATVEGSTGQQAKVWRGIHYCGLRKNRISRCSCRNRHLVRSARLGRPCRTSRRRLCIKHSLCDIL